MNQMISNIAELCRGFKAGAPIAVGFLPIAITFGLLAKTAGLPDYAGILMSLLVYAGASQFVGVNLVLAGASVGEVLIATFVLNLRHFLMSAALAPRLGAEVSRSWRSVLAFGVTDETFTISALQKEAMLTPEFLLGLNVVAFLSWNVGTWLGFFVATELPEVLKSSMGVALYAMFIGLLIPGVKKSREALIVAATAATLNALFHWSAAYSGLSGGWGIIIATVASAALGAYLFTAEEGAL